MRMLSPLATTWSHRNLSPELLGDVFDDIGVVEGFLRPAYRQLQTFKPSCDITETKDRYFVSFDMPGMRKEDIKIEVEGDKLLISGERKKETEPENSEMTLRNERLYGAFERTFELPASIKNEKIEAQFENGVLNIVLPKADAAKSRVVPIQN